jgi:thioesterase domain-containing protein
MSPGFSVYDKVITALDKDQPFYLFIPYSYKKVEDIAAHYIQEMKKIQPKGPYCLGAYCDLGEVALEMAQQLIEEGETVNFLALFEFYYPSVIKPFNFRERINHYFDELGKLSATEKVKFFADVVFRKINRLRNKTMRAIDKIRRLEHEPGYLIGKGLYTAKPYKGKVLLFRSAIQILRIDNSPLMGWSDYFSNAELFTIPGNHKTMFHKPGCIQIAEILNAYSVLKE